MNAAAKELPVSYDLSKPQENKEPYIGSVLFFKHVIFTVTLLLILIPTTLSIYLFAQVRVLYRAPWKNLEASMASRFFCCPETLFSLIFSLIVPQASETLLINCSIRSALSCFICFVTCP